LISEHKIGFMAWDKLYESSFIKTNKFKFPPIYHEDIIFAIKCVYYANKVVEIPDQLYNYYQRKVSISKTKVTEKHLDSYFTVIDNVNDFIEEVDLYAQSPPTVYKLQYSITNWLLDNLLRYYSTDDNSIDKNSKLLDVLYYHYGKTNHFMYCLIQLLLENIIHQKNILNKTNLKLMEKLLFSFKRLKI